MQKSLSQISSQTAARRAAGAFVGTLPLHRGRMWKLNHLPFAELQVIKKKKKQKHVGLFYVQIYF